MDSQKLEQALQLRADLSTYRDVLALISNTTKGHGLTIPDGIPPEYKEAYLRRQALTRALSELPFDVVDSVVSEALPKLIERVQLLHSKVQQDFAAL